ncbi:MAG: hypothetical protein U0791_17325 [Gemmataceae bacterium]
MRRVLLLAVVGLASGCSNAPVAGVLDCVSPSRAADGNREPVVPRIKPPGTDTLPPPAPGPDGGVLPPLRPQ